MIIRKVLLIAGYFDKIGKIANNDKEYFIVLVRVIKTSGMKQSNIESFDGDLFAKLQDGYETISKLEHKNQLLLLHLAMLNSTYEFFDYSNEMGVVNSN